MHKISYVSDGATTEFAFDFPIFQPADVWVAVDGVVSDGQNAYSVIPNSDLSGGRVVFDTAPKSGVSLDIFRQISLSRVIDYQPTARLDVEHLNSDFNFLLAAFQDLRSVDSDMAEWSNRHDEIKSLIDYTTQLISDKMSGGGALGLYRNLLMVLDASLPHLISDYGHISDMPPTSDRDDYGIL